MRLEESISGGNGVAPLNVGTYLASRIQQIGVKDYFVIPGDMNLILLDQILENKNLHDWLLQ